VGLGRDRRLRGLGRVSSGCWFCLTFSSHLSQPNSPTWTTNSCRPSKAPAQPFRDARLAWIAPESAMGWQRLYL
jgi:hypothetical protein